MGADIGRMSEVDWSTMVSRLSSPSTRDSPSVVNNWVAGSGPGPILPHRPILRQGHRLRQGPRLAPGTVHAGKSNASLS